MGTISARLPDDLEADLETYVDEEMLDRSTAVRKLLAKGLAEWRRDRAVERLRDGEVTFTRAADIAGMNVWDFADLLAERNVTWVSGSHLEADLDEL